MWTLKSGDLYVARLFDVEIGPFYTTALKAALKFDSDISAADWHEQAAMKYNLLMHLEPEEVYAPNIAQVLPEQQGEDRPMALEEGAPEAAPEVPEKLGVGPLWNGDPATVDPCGSLTSSSSEPQSESSSGVSDNTSSDTTTLSTEEALDLARGLTVIRPPPKTE